VYAAQVRLAASALAVAGLLAGCAKMDAALGQQWLTVQLSPNTTLAAAKHLTAACSHIRGVRPEAVKPTSAGRVVGSIRFNSTNASDADLARLQQCLQRFHAVQGFTVNEAGY
jgi:hypothetical protein